jgi:hypothetical protein
MPRASLHLADRPSLPQLLLGLLDHRGLGGCLRAEDRKAPLLLGARAG